MDWSLDVDQHRLIQIQRANDVVRTSNPLFTQADSPVLSPLPFCSFQAARLLFDHAAEGNVNALVEILHGGLDANVCDYDKR